ncbi:hypothetical protein U9M48_023108 [Paspalum notatum var. saurae]|uniref:FAD-binding domain-containing protein n=1 Tax=Paspalum notatum var. saurae TaxID=547442 RepID=A0AAQ3TPP9_PASNO
MMEEGSRGSIGDYEMEAAEAHGIVIAGGGICGLATALALHRRAHLLPAPCCLNYLCTSCHIWSWYYEIILALLAWSRKGIASLVLEKSKTLRAEGAAIGVHANGWRVFEQLGVAAELRETAHPPVTAFHEVWLQGNKIIREYQYPVLIGCEGTYSVVAKYLGLPPLKTIPHPTLRGFTRYAHGHPFENEFLQLKVGELFVGRLPINDNLVHFFVNLPHPPTELTRDPKKVRDLALEDMQYLQCPAEIIELVRESDPESLNVVTTLWYRPPWELPEGHRDGRRRRNARHGAFHRPRRLDGAGGRRRARPGAGTLARAHGGGEAHQQEEMIGEAIGEYVRERRLRLARLSLESFVVGLVARSRSPVTTLACVAVLILLGTRSHKHAAYDCGKGLLVLCWRNPRCCEPRERSLVFTPTGGVFWSSLASLQSSGRLPMLLSPRTTEFRCLNRKDLIEALAKDLPAGTIRFGCQVAAVHEDPGSHGALVTMVDGTTIKAKALIGCEGTCSVVAKYLGLPPVKTIPRSVLRGLTRYPHGHPFENEFLRLTVGEIFIGRFTINENLIHFSVTIPNPPTGLTRDPKKVKDLALEDLQSLQCPSEIIELVRGSDPESLNLATNLWYRPPWEVAFGSFQKGTVTVAGDAMHAMGPFIGQGGSAGLEDAVVLARSLARAVGRDGGGGEARQEEEMIGEAIGEYVRERRLRLSRLSLESFVVGLVARSRSPVTTLACVAVLILLGTKSRKHAAYDCGRL